MGLLQVLKDFAATTSIHGLTFLVQPQLSPVKKISWALIFIGALIYAGRQLNISVICKFILSIQIIPLLSHSSCRYKVTVEHNTNLLIGLGKSKNVGIIKIFNTAFSKKWVFCVVTSENQFYGALLSFSKFDLTCAFSAPQHPKNLCSDLS